MTAARRAYAVALRGRDTAAAWLGLSLLAGALSLSFLYFLALIP